MLSFVKPAHLTWFLGCACTLHVSPAIWDTEGSPLANLSSQTTPTNISNLALPFNPRTKPHIQALASSRWEPPWQAVPLVYLYLSAINTIWNTSEFAPIPRPYRIDNADIATLTIFIVPNHEGHYSLNTFSLGWALLGALETIFNRNPWQGIIWDIPVFDIVLNRGNNIGTIHTESFRPSNTSGGPLMGVDDSKDVTVKVEYDGIPLNVKSMLLLLFRASQTFWKLKPQEAVSPTVDKKFDFGPTSQGVSFEVTLKKRIEGEGSSATAAELIQGFSLVVKNELMGARFVTMHGTFLTGDDGVAFADFRFSTKLERGVGSVEKGTSNAPVISRSRQ